MKLSLCSAICSSARDARRVPLSTRLIARAFASDELDQGGGHVAPLALRAFFGLQPQRQVTIGAVRMPVPARIERRGDLEPHAVGIVKIDAQEFVGVIGRS